MKNFILRTMMALAAWAGIAAHAALSVFATVPEWGALAEELGGDKVKVYTATTALQDPHRVEARPSLIARARGADLVVAEANNGGEMVRTCLVAAGATMRPKLVHASRGKVVRAEPISALMEQGRVRLVGRFDKLEDELSAFSTTGYLGDKSPNRADAFVWLISALFPAIVKPKTEWKPLKYDNRGIV